MSESTLPGRPLVSDVAPRRAPWREGARRWAARLTAREMVPFWFGGIFLLAALLRFTGLDWDGRIHHHPDERFLTSVVQDTSWPGSFSAYLDEQTSPLNPRNVGHTFWVYGDFALTVVKGATRLLNTLTTDPIPWDSYDRNHLVGRAVSGLFDLGTLVVLFGLARRLYKDHRVALLAALLFSLTVLSIQHSHFWVVDNFTTFFVTLTLYWLARVWDGEGAGGYGAYALAGLFFGVALATKLSIYTLAVVFGAVAALKLWRAWQAEPASAPVLFEQIVLRMGVAVVCAVLAFRLLQPYAFSGPFTPSERWLENLREVQGQVTGEADPPFGYQWANRTPILFPLKNMVLWGMGLPLGVAAWLAWGAAGWQIVRHNRWAHAIPVLWTLVLFLHQGTQWVKSMRYFLPIYPTLVLLAAWGLVWLWDRARDDEGARTRGLFAWTPTKAGVVSGAVVGGTLLYALAFTSIYLKPHTHLQAAQWIYDNVPSESVVVVEHWDEAIPFGAQGLNTNGSFYYGLTQVVDPATGATDRNGQLTLYDEDTPQKLEEMLGWLDEADYIVTVSNRLYGSTARLPARFPMTGNYYQALFSGELGWERVVDITEGPSLFGIELDDQYSGNPTGWLGLPWDDWLAAEEAFTVYDHPRVQIFQKSDSYDRERARAILSEGVEWEQISRLTAKQWTESGGNPQVQTLQFTPAERATYESSGSWARIFDRDSIANRAPLLVWALLLQAIGLLGLPYMLAVGRGLPERGLAFAKPLGLLLVAWLVWLLASLRVVTFSVGSIALAMGIVGLVGVLLAWRGRGSDLTGFRIGSGLWKPLLLSEAVFWAFFALVLAARWANPDLWHDPMGGEKPMDFAYLNATIKSAHFPPMDPWFAGGYINYYYFGFVLVATLTKLSGVVPEIAYNLALPTLFAMLAAGTWAVALALLEKDEVRRMKDESTTGSSSYFILHTSRGAFRFALLAALLVCVVGNLGELKVLTSSLYQLSDWTFRSGIPGVETAAKSLHGLARMVVSGQTLPGRAEWPYWNPTRVIPSAPINEFPWFTFLYADLHAHLMALPFTVLAIGLAVALLRAPLREGRLAEGLRLALLALVVGALWPMNTWDFPTYALVAFAGLGLREWRRDGRITARGVVTVAWKWALVVALGRLLFHPFHDTYGTAYSSVERWRNERTGLGDFVTIHGLFLFAIAFALVNDFVFGRGHNGAARVLRFRLRHGRRSRAMGWYRRLVQPAPGATAALGALALAVGASVVLALLGERVTALTVFGLSWALLLFFRARPQPAWQMALFFILLGLGLTLAVEWVVLKGDVGRMNTVFKFYLQVWVLWGIAAAVGVAAIAERLPRWLPEWRAVWRVGFTTLFAVALLYPIFATHAKINDRFDRSVGPTLNGAAFLEKAIYHDTNQGTGQAVQIPLSWDAEAIRWMQENVPGSPTVAEINTAPTRLYGWGNRFAMWTGNPAIVGWDNHQRQQRAATQTTEVDQRVFEVKQNIYNTPDAQQAHDTLRRFGADYIVVGALERAYATPEGIAKFEAARGELWDLVYENPEVRIYRVREQGGGRNDDGG